MRGILLIFGTLSANAASFCVTVEPLPLKASALTVATAKEYGLWRLIVTNSTGPVSSGALAEKIPFSVLPEWLAIDVLNRKIASDKRTAIAQYTSGLKDLGPVGLAYASARTSSPIAKGILLSVGGLWALAQARATAKAPDSTSTRAHLLPDAGTQGDWDGVIVSGIVHGATKIGPLCADRGVVPAPESIRPIYHVLTQKEAEGSSGAHCPENCVQFDNSQIQFPRSLP